MEASVAPVLEPVDPRDAKTVGTSVRLPGGFHADLEAYAKSLNKSFNEVITHLARRGWELEQAELRGEAELYSVLSSIRSLASRALRLVTGRSHPKGSA